MDFNTAAKQQHEIRCDTLKVPHDWVVVYVSNQAMEDHPVFKVPNDKFKFLWIELDVYYNTFSGEFIVDPEEADKIRKLA